MLQNVRPRAVARMKRADEARAEIGLPDEALSQARAVDRSA